MNTLISQLQNKLGIQIPSRKTILHLCAGGYIALMAWEIWARTITVWVLGNPLEPPGLVISLVQFWTHYELSLATATFIHYCLGIIGYPVLYYIVSRIYKQWGLLLDAIVWALFSAFLIFSYAHDQLTSFAGFFWLFVTVVTATRFFNPSSFIANCLSWGSFTWFNALGIFAPLAGLPFLLMAWGGGLSFMSYVGHVLFGFVAAYVFEKLEGNA